MHTLISLAADMTSVQIQGPVAQPYATSKAAQFQWSQSATTLLGPSVTRPECFAITCCLPCRCGRSPDDLSSIVLVEEGGHYIKSEAILRIASKLNLPAPLLTALFFPVPKFMADVLYDQVSSVDRL